MDDEWTANLIAKHHGGNDALDVSVVHSFSDWHGGKDYSKGKGKDAKGKGKKGKGKGKDKGGYGDWDS